MERNNFDIITKFVTYWQKRTWTIKNFNVVSEILGTLESPVFSFTQATFCLKYQIIFDCNTKQLKFTIKSGATSFSGFLTVSAALYQERQVLQNITSLAENKQVIQDGSWTLDLRSNYSNCSSMSVRLNIICNCPESTRTLKRNATNEMQMQTWDNKMRQHLSKLYLDPKDSDVTFYVGDSVFPAHKIILATYSPVFKKMFTTQMKEQIDKEVHIKNVTAEAFNCMLCFMYTGVLDDLKNLINELILIADLYDVQELRNECSQFYCNNMNAEIVLDALIIADQLNMDTLRECCYNYILDNKKSILFKKEFDDIKEHHPDIGLKLLDWITNQFALKEKNF